MQVIWTVVSDDRFVVGINRVLYLLKMIEISGEDVQSC